jgi:hypothetical protein
MKYKTTAIFYTAGITTTILQISGEKGKGGKSSEAGT